MHTRACCFTEAEVEPCSGNAKTERCGKGVWYPEELDRDLWGGFRSSVACQALGPGETVVGSFCTRDQSGWWRLSRSSHFSEFEIDTLVTKEFHHLLPSDPHRCQSPHTMGEEAGGEGGRATPSSEVSRGQSTALTRRGFFVAVP